MEQKLDDLKDYVDFLAAVIKQFCVNQLDASLYQDWKKKQGVFKE